MRQLILSLILPLLSVCLSASQFSQSYFLSPYALTRQSEIPAALAQILPKIVAQKITYSENQINYTIQNITIDAQYIDSKQNITIVDNNDVQIRGGKFQFVFSFVWARASKDGQVQGTAEGYMISEEYHYAKQISFHEEGFFIWMLKANTNNNLTFVSKPALKKFNPYNQTDYKVILSMLYNTTDAPLSTQIANKFNIVFSFSLNSTLNSQVFGQNIQYKFNHPSKGTLKMIVKHYQLGWSITPVDGYSMLFLTQIQNYKQLVCTTQIPSTHLNFDHYGGTQNIHSLCMYQYVLEYMQFRKWLDVDFDVEWDVNAFQFYAGDLFDVVSGIQGIFKAKELLYGSCTASPNNLAIKAVRGLTQNYLVTQILYSCLGTMKDSLRQQTNVLNFTAEVTLNIKPQASKNSLIFTIQDAQALNLSFSTINGYKVTNFNLAMFKINQVLMQLKGTHVFGTGFPTLPHQSPKTQIKDSLMVVYFDISHV